MNPFADGLDAQSRAALRRFEADPFLDPAMGPGAMRAAFDRFYAPIDLKPADVASEDRVLALRDRSIRARFYRPRDAAGPPPVTLFCRGGGLIMGSLASYDAMARRICQASDSLVVAVDYRQPPEHRFPASLDDCRDALQWVVANAAALDADASRLAVAGDSGGGTLAAVVAHELADRGGPPLAAQLLLYPAVGRTADSQSMRDYARGYWFEPEALEWLYSQYVATPDQVTDPRVQPLLRADLRGLPPAYILVAGRDILRDDIVTYAARLEAADVPVELVEYPDTIHGFLNMGGIIDYVGPALDAGGAFLRRAFAR